MQEQDLPYCGINCAESCNFEACDMLQSFYSNILHRRAKDNLDEIRLKH